MFDLVVGEKLFLAHVNPHLAVQIRNAPRVWKGVRPKPTAKGRERVDAIGKMNGVVIKNNGAHIVFRALPENQASSEEFVGGFWLDSKATMRFLRHLPGK
ncbi:MAG TPA: hypothetical protein VF278_13480 [Pirellulales bacterium]